MLLEGLPSATSVRHDLNHRDSVFADGSGWVTQRSGLAGLEDLGSVIGQIGLSFLGQEMRGKTSGLRDS